MNPIILPIAELKPALIGLAKVVNSRSALPVLKHVKLERTSAGWINLTGTDLDRFVTMRVERPAEGPVMSVLIPMDQLQQITKNAPKGESIEIDIGLQGNVLIKFALANNLGVSKVKSLPVDEFPVTPRIKSDPIPLPPEFRRSIHEAMGCASTDATRYVLNGAFIDVGNPKAAYVVGTDGRHLYSANSFALPLKDSVIIPTHKFMGWKEFSSDGEWQLKADTENVQIRSRRWRFVSRQIQGTYPNWHQVVPEPSHARTHIVLDPEKLDDLNTLVQRMPCHDDQCCTMGLEWEQKKMFLLAKDNPTDPWLRIPVADVKGEGPDVGIFLDRRFFIKALSYGLNAISIIDELSPMRFSNGGKQLIVMPVRANQEEPKPAEVHERPQEPEPPQPLHIPAFLEKANPPPSAQPPPEPMESISVSERVPAPVVRHMRAVPDQQPAAAPPTIEEAIAMSSTLRDVFLDGADKLRALTVRLRHIQREQKTSAKEMDSFRNRLRSLQDLKL